MDDGIDPSLRRRVIDQGRVAFGPAWTPQSLAIAPGRLELLGNHVDYNGGLVLAGAVDRVVVVGVSRDPELMGLTIIAGDVVSTPFSADTTHADDWRNSGSETGPREYVLGILAALRERGLPALDQAQLSISGDVPLGFGMSSSAALCVALTLALATSRLEDAEVVAVAQEAEHRAGSPVGAMDQSASIAGGVILFDGGDTSFKRLDPFLGDHVFAVADSGIHHAIGTSAYPERVKESQRALTCLREEVDPDLESLGAIDPSAWSEIRKDHPALLGAALTQRVSHVVSEVERVREGMEAIEARDWQRFGSLMSASGRSSATDYDISHPRVEELVRSLKALPGVLGARMMGGGEGGPALALLRRDAVDQVSESLGRGFFARYPSDVDSDRFQVCQFGQGARRTQYPRP